MYAKHQKVQNPVFRVLDFLKTLLIGAALLGVLTGCGGMPPDILSLYWRLNLQFSPKTDVNQSASGRETLSVFIQPWDDDGIEDLDMIYLRHPNTDLFWVLDSIQWQSYSSSGIFWIGSNQFSSGYLGKLPRGDYLLELYDKVGEKAQRFFSMQLADTGELASQITAPPHGDELLFLLPKDVLLYSLIGYDITNQVLFADANYKSIISLRELKVRNDELEKVLLTFQFPNSSVFAQLGPYLVPRIDSGGEALPFPDLTETEATSEDSDLLDADDSVGRSSENTKPPSLDD